MLTHEYRTMRTVEDTYWWYQTLRGMVVREVEKRLKAAPARLLDAGCGTGGMMQQLRRANARWELSGLDASEDALLHTRERGFDDVRQGDVADLPYDDETFRAVVSLDVLYHAGVDQENAVAEFARVLEPDGLLILNLPAFKSLAGSHDVAVKGVRRYTTGDVRALLEPVGFRLEALHYWNAWLFPPILAWRSLSRVLHSRKDGDEAKSDLAELPGPVNRGLAAVSALDARLCRALHLPMGTSVFAVAAKAGR